MKRPLILFVTTILAIATSCQKDSIPPVAVLTAFPETADSTITIEFNASATTDNSTYPEGLMYSWDFDSDGNWDLQNLGDPICLKKFDQSGNYTVRLRVGDQSGQLDYDSVTVEIYPANNQFGELLDYRDGKKYKTVLLKDSWWMAENLDYGNWIQSNQEQEDNELVEKYYFNDDSTGYSKQGGLYEWEEAISYSTGITGICPEGWHLPNSGEWQSLVEKLDPWYAWQYFGPQGLSGFNISDGFSARRENDTLQWGEKSKHWARDYRQLEYLREQGPYGFYYSDLWGDLGIEFVRVYYGGSDHLFLKSSNYASVRCVKNK